MPRILVVDDERTLAAQIRNALQALDGYVVDEARNLSEALQLLPHMSYSVAIVDALQAPVAGVSLMQLVRQVDARLPVIFITGGGTAGMAIEAMKSGAFDYLSKPLDVSQLRELVIHAAAVHELMRDPVRLAVADVHGRPSEGDLLVGRSAVMTQVYKAIGRVAPKNVTVLIRGESGTGKELVARSIYQHSERACQPFIAVNCAAIPESLLESELFGHEKGAFTGADRRRIGKFEQCTGGTIFLDEIGDMPLALQGKILRLVQDQRFERVGGNETIQTDVRIITATHRDLEMMAEAGKFRADLYFRLNVYEITLPPLRARREDLPLLIAHFLSRANAELEKEVTSVSDKAMELLVAYHWPGNIRELQSTLKKTVLNTSGPVLLPVFLPPPICGTSSAITVDFPRTDANIQAAVEWSSFVDAQLQDGSETVYDDTLARMERWLFTRVLRHTGGNQLQAAARLGITRTTLRTKLAKLGIAIGKVVDDSHKQ